MFVPAELPLSEMDQDDDHHRMDGDEAAVNVRHERLSPAWALHTWVQMPVHCCLKCCAVPDEITRWCDMLVE